MDKRLRPDSADTRLEILTKMVQDVKKNSGEYDHDPLATSAFRLQYECATADKKKSYALAMRIQGKIFDKVRYNYKPLIGQLKSEAAQAQAEQDRARYDELTHIDIQSLPTVQEQIDVYREMIELVNAQQWGRCRKFETKAAYCEKMVPLLKQTGQQEEYGKYFQLMNKLKKAAKAAHEAARIKGYKFSPKNPYNNGR
jgi:hypothetical protein